MNLGNLAKMSILNEADDLFDIDKEVDAQLKRVQKRVERKQQLEENPPTDEDRQDQELDQQETQETEEESEYDDESTQDNNEGSDNIESSESNTGKQDAQSGDYEYMDGSGQNIPDNYEPKQVIPELRILSTLSDTEYQLCNIKIMEQFRELRNNVSSTINNIIMNINSRNIRQKQVLDYVQDNLREMVEDIDNYILYRNNDVYEENVTAFLTYLKRYQIATNLIKIILNENSKNV